MSTSLKVAIELCSWYYSIYVWLIIVNLVSFRIGYGAPEIRSLIIELKPLFWPTSMMFLASEFARPELMAWQKALDVFGVLVGWHLLKQVSDDDDRWKKRRKKLLEKVSAVGGRLVVTPA